MQSTRLQALLLLALGALIGWAGSRAVAGSSAGAAAGNSDRVLATVGRARITEADVEASRPADFVQINQQRHDLMSQALESAIKTKLVDLEAEARGMESDELLAEEVDAKVEEPTDARVEAFFRDRGLQGSLERLAPQIRLYLREQARTVEYNAFVATLEARYDVERRLEPLRVTIDSEGFPSKGPEDAPVTLVEFSDFQCPYCRSLFSTLRLVEETYGNQLRFVYRQFPLSSIHPQADNAALASLCAEEQGKFWEMHGAMFQNQQALQVDQLKATARELGLDGETFDTCLDSGKYLDRVAADVEAGMAVGVQGTPMLFINGRPLSGAKSFEEISAIIDEELERAGQ